MYYATEYISPLGKITLACDGKGEKLVGLWLEGQKYHGGTLPEALREKNELPLFDLTKNGWTDILTGRSLIFLNCR